MFRSAYITIKKGLTYPAWGNPIHNWRQMQLYWKQIMEIPGTKEIYREQNRHGIAFMIEVVGFLMIFVLVLSVF